MSKRAPAAFTLLAAATIATALVQSPVANAAPGSPVNPDIGRTSGCPNDPNTFPSSAQMASPAHTPVHIGIPYPKFTVVPVPGPPESTKRIPQAPLPADPCQDPCPQITDVQTPPPGTPQGSTSSSDHGSSAGSSGGTPFGSSTGSNSNGFNLGSSGSSALNLPGLSIGTDPVTIPIPVPGPPQHLPPPPPTAHPPVQPAPQSQAPATPHVSNVSKVARETGAGSINRTDKRWQVDGTDLGIMWQSKPGQIAVAFGDTFGKGFHPPGANGSDWRSNVLAFSNDKNLSDGMSFNSMVQNSDCHATELLGSRKVDNFEITTIPTSGFALNGRQYMSYMSVKHWGVPGTWLTNYGGIAYSDNDGQTWTKDPYAKWNNLFGFAQFQVTSMVPHNGYVYMFGTPNGRLGAVALARVPDKQILNKSAYQYWENGNWTPVESKFHGSTVVSAPVGELSIRYDDQSKLWQMTYLDPATGAIVLREAKTPQGAWTAAVPLVTSKQFPQIYGGFIHPWSSGNNLYFTVSEWTRYNVSLMHATIS